MRAARICAALACLCLAGLFSATYYLRHRANAECFNSEGRCFDPERGTVILQQAGVVWASLALLCLAVTAVLIWSLKHRS